MPSQRTKPPGRSRHSPEDELVKREVGANIKRIREYRRFSQRKFAELLEIPYSTLNKYEIGKSFPTPAVFRNLIARTGANMQYLFTGTGPMFMPNVHEISKARKADLDQRFG